MFWAVLIVLAQPGEAVTRERVMRLVEKLPDAKSDLIKLGPSALRILAEARRPAVSDVIFELKCAGLAAGVREQLEREIGVRTAPFPIAEIDERCGAFLELPVVVDLGLDHDRRNRTIRITPGRLDSVLCAALSPSGLDYAVVRGRILISTPDRLWSYPCQRERVLSPEEARSVRQSIARLGDDKDAAAALLETGSAAVPYLEEELRTAPLEAGARTRIVDLVRELRARERPAPFARGLALERQAANDLDQVSLRGLREKTTTLKIESSLEGAVKMLARTAGLDADVAEASGRIRVAVALPEMPVLDALFFVLASHDLDGGLVNGRLKVGACEDVERMLRRK